MNKLIPAAALAAALAVASSANAADIARPVYKAPVMAPVVYNWTGFYIGGNAGYNWSNSNAVNSTSVAGPCNPALTGCFPADNPNYSQLAALGATGSMGGKLDGFMGGGQIGYNWQVQNWVWGIEADFQGIANSDSGGAFNTLLATPTFPLSPVATTVQLSRSLDWFGTVRGRLGFLATPAALFYATGGLAYGQAKLNASYAQACVNCGGVISGTSAAVSVSDTRVGWTVGGGVEWMMAPNWTVKAEYLYYDLGDLSATVTVPGTAVAAGLPFMRHSPTVDSRFDGHILRAGLNYKFN